MVINQAINRAKDFEGEVKDKGRHILYDDKTGKPLKPGDEIKGIPTIGWGINLLVGLDDEEALFITTHRVSKAYDECNAKFSWFSSVSVNRQAVLTDLCYNMGMKQLLGFKNFLKAMEVGMWEDAAKHLLDSQYAKQVGRRATQNAELIRVG